MKLSSKLKVKEGIIQASEREKSQLRKDYEMKIEETRRETREKVQKVMEKRYSKAKQDTEVKSPKMHMEVS